MEVDVKHKHPSRMLLFVMVAMLTWLTATLFLTVRSYSYCDELTYSDATLTMDEGLSSLMVPLTRLAPGQSAETNCKTYALHKDRWVCAGGIRIPTRNYMEILRKGHQDETLRSGMFYGFGYLLADQSGTSASRPGYLLWLIAPTWSVTAVIAITLAVPMFLRSKFTLRALMIFIAIAAGVLVLPTLHAPARYNLTGSQ